MKDHLVEGATWEAEADMNPATLISFLLLLVNVEVSSSC